MSLLSVSTTDSDLEMSCGTIRNRAWAGLIAEAGSAKVTGCTIEDIGVAEIVVNGRPNPCSPDV